MQNWNPDHVPQYMERRNQELALIGGWVSVTRPPEPDPLWFSEPLENWVANQITGPNEDNEPTNPCT